MQLNLALCLSSQDEAELIVNAAAFLTVAYPAYRLSVRKTGIGDGHVFAVQRPIRVENAQGWSDPHHTSDGTFVEICALLTDLGVGLDQWQPVEDSVRE